jgi:hypothetical protein
MNFMELLRAVIPTPAELKQQFREWVQANAKFWGVSLAAHVVILLVLGVVMGASAAGKLLEEVVFIDSEVDTAEEQPPVEHFEIGETPIEPSVLNTETLTEPPATIEQDAQYNDASAEFMESGGGTATGTSTVGGLGLSLAALGDGPALSGAAGLEVGKGEGTKGGSGGAGEGFGGRGSGSREKMLASGGGTADTERAVAGAANWLARHQNQDGSWGLGPKGFGRQCKDPSCMKCFVKKPSPDGKPTPEPEERPMAATAFGILPYLAAGQTHETAGPHKGVITRALTWMTRNQDPKNGNLGGGKLGGNMYDHGLATIALCEAYGLSKDRKLGPHAQMAVAYIEDAQNDQSGGWHYGANPPTEGDTSVVGWQMMALKSAEMAGLKVNPQTIVKAKSYLKTVAKGKSGGQFSYTSKDGATPTMSAVGLLCNQYGGMKRTDPAMIEGQAYVMAHLPQAEGSPYFFYYATQVMHNLPGPEWDTWNRHARRFLIKSQIKSHDCNNGSWDPTGKGHVLGPVMMTSICSLTLEVYYRYLPLYQIDKGKMDKGE